MQQDGAPITPEPVPETSFEPPRLTPLGSLTDLTRAFVPGNDVDFTMTSF